MNDTRLFLYKDIMKKLSPKLFIEITRIFNGVSKLYNNLLRCVIAL